MSAEKKIKREKKNVHKFTNFKILFNTTRIVCTHSAEGIFESTREISIGGKRKTKSTFQFLFF